MPDDTHFIPLEQRPDVTIDLNQNVCALSLRELRELVLHTVASSTDEFKTTSELAQKNNNKDKANKERSDLKAQQDHKNNVDKQARDQSAAPGLDLTSEQEILVLLRRLLAEDQQGGD